jgi:hypothetical protein
LVVSDDESSDDESVDTNPSPLPDSGSEGDNIWHADHPSLQDEVQPLPIVELEPEEIPEAPNIAPEGASPSDDNKGRTPGGQSRRLKDQPRPCYYCTLGEKQIPPEVRQSSLKQMKY